MPSKMSHSQHHLWTCFRYFRMGSHLPLLHLQCRHTELSSGPYTTTVTTLNIGLSVIISVAVVAVLYVQFFVCDELLGAITLLNIALLTVGAGGLIGTIAYYQAGSLPPMLSTTSAQPTGYKSCNSHICHLRTDRTLPPKILCQV